jgi:hypothetical protein
MALCPFFLVSLQPFEYDPNDKNRHKFMVQSIFAPDGEINQDMLVCETSFVMKQAALHLLKIPGLSLKKLENWSGP